MKGLPHHIAIPLFLLLLSIDDGHSATSAETKRVAKELVCLCGDCNRESLATCQCDYAVDRRTEIGTALDSGHTDVQMIAQFVENYGQHVLATPPPQGYNLLAWIIPFAIMIVAAFLLRSVLVNWKRDRPRLEPTSAMDGGEISEDNYQQQLRSELRDSD